MSMQRIWHAGRTCLLWRWALPTALALGLVLAAVGVVCHLRGEAIRSQSRELGLLSLALSDEIHRELRGMNAGLRAMQVELAEGGLAGLPVGVTQDAGVFVIIETGAAQRREPRLAQRLDERERGGLVVGAHKHDLVEVRMPPVCPTARYLCRGYVADDARAQGRRCAVNAQAALGVLHPR